MRKMQTFLCNVGTHHALIKQWKEIADNKYPQVNEYIES